MGTPLQSVGDKSTKEKEIKPKMHFLALTLVATGASALTLTKDLKAASPLVNLGCQCSSLTFVDSQGQVQGNCRSVDSTGARWCYVDHLPSSCQDLSHSARFPATPWSYEACSTPPENSGHHHHVQPAYTAPVHHQPAYTVPAHPRPNLHCPSSPSPSLHCSSPPRPCPPRSSLHPPRPPAEPHPQRLHRSTPGCRSVCLQECSLW